MKNPFKILFRQYLYFSKKDRNAILTLSILIVISIIAVTIVKLQPSNSKYNYAEYAKQFEEWEKANQISSITENKFLFEFNPNTISGIRLDSLLLPENIKRNIINYRNAGGRFSIPAQLQKIYGMNDSIFSELEKYIKIPVEIKTEKNTKIPEAVPLSGFFDPNLADLDTLTKFGFNKFQSANLINYRNKGGVFYNKADLLKIYGIDSLFFNTIENHIKIKLKEKVVISSPEVTEKIELNHADSAALVKLSGIGPAFATRIIKYRDLLGGFYSKSQLLEVYNFPVEVFQDIEKQISTDTLLLKKVRINFVEFEELLRHPYLNKQQVQAILAYREKNGAFGNVALIQQVSLIDNKTFARIRPYITCR